MEKIFQNKLQNKINNVVCFSTQVTAILERHTVPFHALFSFKLSQLYSELDSSGSVKKLT